MTTLIELQRINKSFGEGPEAVQALSNVSLSVDAGELTLLMGPSGSGKTTLLSIMGCILSPTSGRVWICGHDATRLSTTEFTHLRLRHIGFVFQAYNLFPTLTVRENVRMAFCLKGIKGKEAKDRAAQAIAEVGLADKMDTFPKNLSGGQKQRVAIARALAGEHNIILADEPTAALDYHSGQTVLNLPLSSSHATPLMALVALARSP
jgi:ABC-type antimicrobial peptide transport system, ATPase component